MPVTSYLYKKSFSLMLDKGLNPETNKMMTTSKTFANVNQEATDEAIYTAASVLSGLQTMSASAIRKTEVFELVSE